MQLPLTMAYVFWRQTNIHCSRFISVLYWNAAKQSRIDPQNSSRLLLELFSKRFYLSHRVIGVNWWSNVIIIYSTVSWNEMHLQCAHDEEANHEELMWHQRQSLIAHRSQCASLCHRSSCSTQSREQERLMRWVIAQRTRCVLDLR